MENETIELEVIFEDYQSKYIPMKVNRVDPTHKLQIRQHIATLIQNRIEFYIKIQGKQICSYRDVIKLNDDRMAVNGNSYAYTGLYIEIK